MVTGTRLLTVLDPTVEAVAPEGVYAQRPDTLEGKRIGLLANGKRNADRLLAEVSALLGERYHVSFLSRNKGNASRPAPREIVDELAQKCDLVVTATGD